MGSLFCICVFCSMLGLAVGAVNGTARLAVKNNSRFRLSRYNEKQKGRSELTRSSPACHRDCTSYGGWCYCKSSSGSYSVPRKTTYAQAIENCRIMGGNLASIHGADEDAFLRGYARQALIGLKVVDGQFTWSDDSAFEYSGADPNFKNFAGYLGYCAQLGDTYWENVECDFSEWYHACKMLPSLYPNYECPDQTAVHFDSGTLYSPGYPYYYYGSGTICKYMIAAANSHRIEITFETTNMAPGDCIYFYEGFNEDNNLGWLCGSFSSTYTFRTSSMNRMMLLFTTNLSTEGFWIISYRTIA